MAGDRGGGGPYVRPRIALAVGLALLYALLLTLDARDPGYQMSELTQTILVGAILALVGIELDSILRGGR